MGGAPRFIFQSRYPCVHDNAVNREALVVSGACGGFPEDRGGFGPDRDHFSSVKDGRTVQVARRIGRVGNPVNSLQFQTAICVGTLNFSALDFIWELHCSFATLGLQDRVDRLS